MLKILLTFCSLLVATVSIFANIYPVSLIERIDSSEQVILAKAIDQQSYWALDSSGIYTTYTMEVICYAKNPNNLQYFDLILPGGTVGEEVQINYPHIQLLLGGEYLVAVEDVTLYQLNRSHRARSSSPIYQPYSYVQGVLPMNNGYYSDYTGDTLIQESDLLTYIENTTQEEAKKPDGTVFESRDSFPIGNGDLDGDGVMDIYDEDPNDPYSDSDGDGISDWLETNPDPITDPNTGAVATGYASNPLNACDPSPSSSCIGLDFDMDGRFSNYAPTHANYDSNDEDPCIPYATQAGCPLFDEDGDGLVGNLPPNDPNHDPNDNNPCNPINFVFLNTIQDSYIDFSNQNDINGNKTTLSLEETPFTAKRAVIQLEEIPPVPQNAYVFGTLYFHIDSLNYSSSIIFNSLPDDWDESNLSWSNAGNYGDYLFELSVDQTGWVAVVIPMQVFTDYLYPTNTNFGIVLRTLGSDMTISSSESDNPPYLTIQLDPLNCELPPAREPIVTTTTTPTAITLKNGAGMVTDTFVAGTITTDHEMIIEGAGFGDTPGLIEFPNVDNGGFSKVQVSGSDLLYWTNTKIHIKIPKEAGSGTVEIKAATGELLGSKNVAINWALIPLYHDFKSFDKPTRQRIHFVDANDEGGYTFHLNTNSGFKDNVAAVIAFERALQTWQCASQVNWKIDPTGTTIEKGNDGICVVQFNKNLPAGVLGLASSRYKATAGSSCNQYNTLWRLKEVDIEFADPSILPAGFSWHYEASTPIPTSFDFESIALHELGHAHGLGHVTDQESPMYYSLSNGKASRELNSSDLAAASHKMSYSLADKCVSSHSPMIALTDCATSTPPSIFNYTEIKVMLEGFYNPTAGKMNTQLQETALLPLSNPYTVSPFNYMGTETVTAMPSDITDWILLELRDVTNTDSIIHQQAVLLKNDGRLVSLEESTNLRFDGIESGSYYITIHHKNHLPIMSSEPHTIGPSALLYDFTSTETAALGEAQLKAIDGQYFMFGGDFDNNGAINNLDYNIWKTNSAKLNIYSIADADGNGIINSLDYNLLKLNLSKIGALQR